MIKPSETTWRHTAWSSLVSFFKSPWPWAPSRQWCWYFGYSLTHWDRDKLAIFSNAFSLDFKWYFIKMCSSGFIWQHAMIGSDKGLVPNSRQVFIWTNVGLVYWRIYASLGLNELMLSNLSISLYDIHLKEWHQIQFISCQEFTFCSDVIGPNHIFAVFKIMIRLYILRQYVFQIITLYIW